MAYNVHCRSMSAEFSADTLEEVVQHFREGWQNAHDGKPYERFESSYRQDGWRQYFLLSGSPINAAQAAAEEFKREVGYYPYCS
jgi:hypothetical protein